MIPVILDVDTGIDDALAILFAVAHPELDVRAITCVDGNTSLDQVVANTLAVLDAAGAGDIPVAAGARDPLIELSREAAWVHGADGLAETHLPASPRKPATVTERTSSTTTTLTRARRARGGRRPRCRSPSPAACGRRMACCAPSFGSS